MLAHSIWFKLFISPFIFAFADVAAVEAEAETETTTDTDSDSEPEAATEDKTDDADQSEFGFEDEIAAEEAAEGKTEADIPAEQETTAEETTGEEKESDTESKATAAPAFDAQTKALASNLGLSEEKLAALGSEELYNLVGNVVRMAAQQQQQAQPQPQTTATTPTPAPTQQPASVSQAADTVEEFKIDLNEEDMDPEYAKAMKAMAGEINRLRKENLSTRQQVEAPQNAAQQAQAAHIERVNRFDKWAASKPEYQKLFGVGASLNMDPQSDLFKARNRVFTLAENMGVIWGADNEDQIYEQAAAMTFKDELINQAKIDGAKEVTKKLDKRAKNSMVRPTHRKTTQSDGKNEKERAANELWKLSKERGLGLVDDRDDVEDTIF